MSFSLSVRLTPGQLAALDALVQEEGGTRVGHIRTGIRMRLDLDLQRQAINKIVREEVKTALDQILEAAAATDATNRQLMASFLTAIQNTSLGSSATPAPVPISTSTGGAHMPPRSR